MGHEIFSEKNTGPWNIYVYGLLGYEIFCEKFVKSSGPTSYILNVCSLSLDSIICLLFFYFTLNDLVELVELLGRNT